jgi:hypothetical protein
MQNISGFKLSCLVTGLIIGVDLCVLITGCKSQSTTITQTELHTVTATVTTTGVGTAQPKLNTVNLSLAIAAPAEFASATVPIYINQNQTIHLNWTVVGGPIRMDFTSPNGKIGSIGKNGVTTASAVILDYTGELRFCPTDAANKAQNWGGNGYYYFILNIVKGDQLQKSPSATGLKDKSRVFAGLNSCIC